MKIRKQGFVALFVMLSICVGLFWPSDTVLAASGKTAVSVSSGTVNIGDTVTVSVSASGASGEHAVAMMTVSWDAGILQFAGCSTTYGGGGGSVTATGDKFTVTLTAVAAGTSAISVSGEDGVLFDTNEELESMAGSSASVTVNNAAGGGAAGGGNAGGGNAGGAAGGGTDTGIVDAGGGNAGGGAAGGTAPLSADNSLKSLTISPGTLSPSFVGKTTKYSATVSGDVTSVAVSAVPANEKAVVESVTGNEGLKVGTNTVKIVVRAENGVTATYTISVTRQGGGTDAPGQSVPEDPDAGNEPGEPEVPAEAVTINGMPWQVKDDFTAEDIPSDFTENAINYHGTEYKGVSFINGMFHLLWLTPVDADGTGRFFVYDETRDVLYPFVRLGDEERYVIALLSPVDTVLPENYHQTELKIRDGESITAYQAMTPEESEIGSDFYLFYAVNASGTEGWYQYDQMEGTYQRLNPALAAAQEETTEIEEIPAADPLQEDYDALQERYKEARRSMGGITGILIFVIAVLLVILVNQLVHRFKNRTGDADDDEFDEDDGYGEDFDDEEDDRADESDEEPAEQKRGFFFGRKRSAKEEPEDDWEDDFIEEEARGESDVETEEPEDNWADDVPEDDRADEMPEDDWASDVPEEPEDDRADEMPEDDRASGGPDESEDDRGDEMPEDDQPDKNGGTEQTADGGPIKVRQTMSEPVQNHQVRRRSGGNLSAEEYAERREATERFFAEEPAKKPRVRPEHPQKPAKKKEEKKEDRNENGSLEVIDFNDL